MKLSDKSVRRCGGCGSWKLITRNCVICELIFHNPQDMDRTAEQKKRHREYQDALRNRYELEATLRAVPNPRP